MEADTLAAINDTAVADSTDEALMQRYVGGDCAAFDVLYTRHRGPLYRYLLRGCGDRDLAGELFQDVWTRVIRSRKRYRKKARFTTWLFTIAHNRLVDHYRRQRPRGEASVEPPAPPSDQPEIRAGQCEAAQRLHAAIADLPFAQREAILLKEERGLSLAEIADVTGVGRETVKSRLRYALAKLREALPHE